MRKEECKRRLRGIEADGNRMGRPMVPIAGCWTQRKRYSVTDPAERTTLPIPHSTFHTPHSPLPVPHSSLPTTHYSLLTNH
jgi:hypothetical protein